MHLPELSRSTAFRFALALTAAFLTAYAAAGLVAFRAINAGLQDRVIQAVELSAERYEDTFEQGGTAALLAAVNARAGIVDADDEFIWLGTSDGVTRAGHAAPAAALLTTGPAMGAELGTDPDDRYWIVVRNFGGLRLITGQSFEESDAVGRTVLGAFAGATLLILLLAGLSAALLARRAQRRLDRISATLADVSLGNMRRRIRLNGSDDDLDRLSASINEALEQLERTVESIRQVSVDIAHDLRTPLSRLGIRVEQLLADNQHNPELSERLETTAKELKQITSMFDSLLRIAQIEAGARKARFRPVALPEIGAALHEAYLPVAEENGQQLALRVTSTATALVDGDRDLLTQLFANLLENAIRHSPPGAHILMEIGSGPRGSWMSVADDGPGIPSQEWACVTRRFYRLDKSRQTAGSGLGLALVKAICDLHGAQLEFDDNHPGLIVRLRFDPCQQMRVT
ncbi:MAG: hypothetical protein KDI10_18665 [Halioglobus sp.]|nr:hypothetical protein [Halioglobus sp.]